MSHISIRVEPLLGSHLQKVIKDCLLTSARLCVSIECKFNDFNFYIPYRHDTIERLDFYTARLEEQYYDSFTKTKESKDMGCI